MRAQPERAQPREQLVGVARRGDVEAERELRRVAAPRGRDGVSARST